MKYAFMTFSCKELNLDDCLALASQYGYDGIEPRAEAKHGHGVEIEATAGQRADIKAKAEAKNVALCCIATSCKYADPSEAAAAVERTRQFIDLAGDVGSPRLRVFGGVIPEGVTREQAADSIVASLSAVADQAVERGVVVCIETHDDWCKPTDLAGILERVNHPGIAANWDIMHPIRRGGATMAEAYEVMKPWTKHIHFHDGVMEQPPEGGSMMRAIGTGCVDHRAAVKHLLDMGYDGYLSGEWINWEPYDEHLPREIATMKGYEQE